MKKSFLLSVAAITFSCVISYGQTSNSSGTQASTPVQKLEGTYQIQVVNPRVHPSIPGDLEKIVMENRQASTVKYISLGTLVRLKIMPESEISKPGFTKLEKIKYVTEEEFKKTE